MKDAQRGKVYAAENYLHKEGLSGARFGDLEAIDRWVNSQVLQSTWFIKHFPNGPKYLRILPGRQKTSSWAYGSTELLRLPLWAWTPLTILHEVSHGVSRLKYGYPFGAKHNWCFTKTFLALIKHFMPQGKELSTVLRKQYVARRVRHRKPPLLSEKTRYERQQRGYALAAELQEKRNNEIIDFGIIGRRN